jgi:hypothetical protein
VEQQKMMTWSGTKYAEKTSPKNSSFDVDPLDSNGEVSDDDDDDDNDDDGEMRNDPAEDEIFIALGLQYELHKYSRADHVFLKKRLGLRLRLGLLSLSPYYTP